MCGENKVWNGVKTAAEGSSPRVRGKQRAICNHDTVTGLIPACAGKTPDKHAISPRNGAHPRVCGENELTQVLHHQMQGSSPRVRGKLCSQGMTRY